MGEVCPTEGLEIFDISKRNRRAAFAFEKAAFFCARINASRSRRRQGGQSEE
jgi:hypothetical protein